MRAAVIDDERPARSELIHQLRELVPDAEIEEGDCGAAALQLMEKKKYDICFLDINLGDINGTILVGALKNMQPDMKIVFVTAYSEYAVKAFELDVADYIMKPYSKSRLEKVLKKCCLHLFENRGSGCQKRLAINSAGKTIFENIGDIVYIETYNRGCMIHAAGGEYFEGKTIGEFERQLEGMRFFRCHKSYLINLDKVREVFPWGNNSFGLRMTEYEAHTLPVGREKVKILRQMLERV